MYISLYAGFSSTASEKPIPSVLPAGLPSAYANMLISVDSVTAIEVYAPPVPAVPVSYTHLTLPTILRV